MYMFKCMLFLVERGRFFFFFFCDFGFGQQEKCCALYNKNTSFLTSSTFSLFYFIFLFVLYGTFVEEDRKASKTHTYMILIEFFFFVALLRVLEMGFH